MCDKVFDVFNYTRPDIASTDCNCTDYSYGKETCEECFAIFHRSISLTTHINNHRKVEIQMINVRIIDLLTIFQIFWILFE